MSDELRLSICISTFNRAEYIVETLDSIMSQMQVGVELVVVDGASPDNTWDVMGEYLSRYPDVRYFREEHNSGVDADYDRSVSYARGEFCWLMTDDDLLAPDAITTVLAALNDEVDLVVVNATVKNSDLSVVLDQTIFNIENDKSFSASDNKDFFVAAAQGLSFIGCVIVRRQVWLSRDRTTYFGTLFVHVGAIFQTPPIQKVKMIAAPLIDIRFGNAMWTARGFEIWMFKWPELVWSFDDYPASAKSMVFKREPWKSLKLLALYRALGGYTYKEYDAFLAGNKFSLQSIAFLCVARFPAKLMNAIVSLHCAFLNKGARMGMYSLLKSKNATWVTRWASNILGVSDHV